MRYLFILSLLLLEVTLGLKAQTETQESNTLSQQDSMEVIVESCQKSFCIPFCHLSIEASDEFLMSDDGSVADLDLGGSACSSAA